MAKKKVRRSKKKQSQGPVQSAAAAEVVASSRSKLGERRRVTQGQTSIPKKITSVEQLKDEYSYVLKDLRLIFAIAGVMFLILFGLNLVLG